METFSGIFYKPTDTEEFTGESLKRNPDGKLAKCNK
jgi:hypothetical protein